MRLTPPELESGTTVSGRRVSALRSGDIDTGPTLLAKVDCRQHDKQQVSPRFPRGPFELWPLLASTLEIVWLETR